MKLVSIRVSPLMLPLLRIFGPITFSCQNSKFLFVLDRLIKPIIFECKKFTGHSYFFQFSKIQFTFPIIFVVRELLLIKYFYVEFHSFFFNEWKKSHCEYMKNWVIENYPMRELHSLCRGDIQAILNASMPRWHMKAEKWNEMKNKPIP